MIIHSKSSTSSFSFDPVKPNKLSMSNPKLSFIRGGYYISFI